jgi:DNA-binding winged helix-turn-helix (wHTH) protein
VATDLVKPSILRFGIFELDYRTGELRRAGAAVKLPPQPFKVLWLLASRPGEVVSREEIRQALWGEDTYVDFDSGLNFCINQIRRALRDSAESPRFIHTLPRRGYRFLATVEMVRPPLDESEMPDVAVSAPGLALLTHEEEPITPDPAEPPVARREREIRPMVVERVRPVRWRLPTGHVERPLTPGAGESVFPAPSAPPTGFRGRLSAVARRGWVRAVALVLLAASCLALGATWASRATTAHPVFQRITFRRGSVQSGRLAGDGTLVYSASWDGGAPAVYLGFPRSAEARRISEGTLLAAMPAGEVLASLPKDDGTAVMAQVPASGAPPRELMANVTFSDWTATGGGRIAAVRQVGSEQRLEYPIGNVLLRTTRNLTHVRVSPDGGRVAFLEHPAFGDDRGLVALVEAGGGHRVLTGEWSSAEGLAWSPDGREIWFTAARTGMDAQIHAVDLAGRVREVLRSPGRLVLHDVGRDGSALVERSTVRFELRGRFDGAGERDLSWLDSSLPTDLSPDGSRVVFCESGEGGGPGYAVYLRKTDGAPPVKLGEGMASTLSPDGRWVAAIAVTGDPRLVLLPTAAGETRVLRTDGVSGYTGVGWTPDANTIVFGARSAGGPLRLHAQAVNGGGAREVSPVAIRGTRRFPVAPDGDRVAVPQVEGGIAIVRLKGGAAAPVAGTRRGDRPLAWTSDGGALYVQPVNSLFLERLDVASGARETVADLTPYDRAGMIGPLSPVITADGRAYVWGFARRLSELYVVTGLR